MAILRNIKLCDDIFVVSNIDHRFLALSQIEEIEYLVQDGGRFTFIFEEEGRNTAAAIAFSAFLSKEDEIIFVTPSDHLIERDEKYSMAVELGREAAEKGYIVVFGVEAKEPNTGYGYIKVKSGEGRVLDVELFKEKPDQITAESYIEENRRLKSKGLNCRYYWNSGMFMFKAGVFLEELRRYRRDIYEASKRAIDNAKRTKNDNNESVILEKNLLLDLPEISVDYAVIEKSDKVKAVLSDFKWDDLGNFDSLAKNVSSNAPHLEVDSNDNFYYSDSNKLTVGIGLNGYVVVDTKDVLLISKKGLTQNIKNIVDKLKNSEYKDLVFNHKIVNKPWGSFETLLEEKGFKVKKIMVNPGKRLSLQKHFHRSEHWVVVDGNAEVQIGEKRFLLKSGESVYIKKEEFHRLSNPGEIPVVLIEIQLGEILDEDDIVRIEDDYGRS